MFSFFDNMIKAREEWLKKPRYNANANTNTNTNANLVAKLVSSTSPSK